MIKRVELYIVMNKDSIFYGYAGAAVYMNNVNVCLEIVRNKNGARCYEGRHIFARIDVQKIGLFDITGEKVEAK